MNYELSNILFVFPYKYWSHDVVIGSHVC